MSDGRYKEWIKNFGGESYLNTVIKNIENGWWMELAQNRVK
jgi:hypothetical protein